MSHEDLPHATSIGDIDTSRQLVADFGLDN
jgi:hypothetical protein